MKIKLSYKIFSALFISSLIIAVLMGEVIEFYVYKNFSAYFDKIELDVLGGLDRELTRFYREHQSWEKLKLNNDNWLQILNPDGPHHPPFFPDFSVRPPPPRPISEINSAVTLFDINGKPVIGEGTDTSNHLLRELSANGKVIGLLALKKREPLAESWVKSFLDQQFKVFYYLVVAGIIILAGASFILSRHLVAPIRKLTEGTRELTSFNFQKRINVNTSDELGQLAADFNIMARTLERSEQMQQQWISDIAHEMRTPLSILLGEIEAMQDGVRKMDRDTLDSLRSEVLYLRKIVNDLHDLSMIESGTLKFKKSPISLIEGLKGTLKLFQTRLNKRQMTVMDELDISRDYFVKGDPDRLKQVFSNILENTLRYPDVPGILKVWQDREEDNIIIYFEDSGPGVPEKSLELLFDRLYRVDPSRNRSRGGSGLGLAICKNIIEHHEGKITAENGPSGGLRVRIKLPLN